MTLEPWSTPIMLSISTHITSCSISFWNFILDTVNACPRISLTQNIPKVITHWLCSRNLEESEKERERGKNEKHEWYDWINSSQEYNQIVEISMKLKRKKVCMRFRFELTSPSIIIIIFRWTQFTYCCMVDFHSICFVTQKMRRI